MFLALLATQSAAGIASVLVVASFALPRRIRFGLPIIVGLWAASCVFLLISGRLSYLASPVISGEPNSISVRLQLWDIAWDLAQAHPVLGIGLGTFEPAYQNKLHERFAAGSLPSQAYSPPTPLAEFVYRDPHNWILSFWLNMGIIGLISFTFLHVWILRPWLHIHYSAPFAALAVLLLFGLVDTIYWKNDLSALHWVLLAQAIQSPLHKRRTNHA